MNSSSRSAKPFLAVVRDALQIIERICHHKPRIKGQKLIISHPFYAEYLIYPQLEFDLKGLKLMKLKAKDQAIILICNRIQSDYRKAFQRMKISYCSLDGHAHLCHQNSCLILEEPIFSKIKIPRQISVLAPSPVNGLNPNQIQIAYLLLNNPMNRGFTYNEIMKQLGISRSTVSRCFQLFQSAGWIIADPLYLYKLSNRSELEALWVREFSRRLMPILFRAYFQCKNKRAEQQLRQAIEQNQDDFKAPYLLQKSYIHEVDGELIHIFSDLKVPELAHKHGLEMSPQGNIALYRTSFANAKWI